MLTRKHLCAHIIRMENFTHGSDAYYLGSLTLYCILKKPKSNLVLCYTTSLKHSDEKIIMLCLIQGSHVKIFLRAYFSILQYSFYIKTYTHFKRTIGGQRPYTSCKSLSTLYTYI